MWNNFKKTKPEINGYYYVYYENTDGHNYYKAFWWNGEEFVFHPKRKMIKEVFKWLPERHEYYCPCQIYGDKVLDEESESPDDRRNTG